MQNEECRKTVRGDSEACGSVLIDAEIAFSADFYARCYGLASAGQPSGLDLGSPFIPPSSSSWHRSLGSRWNHVAKRQN